MSTNKALETVAEDDGNDSGNGDISETSPTSASSDITINCLKATNVAQLGEVSRQQIQQIHSLDGDLICLLLQDTTLRRAPVHLEELFRLYSGMKISKSEAFFLLVYLVALECGFAELSSYEKCVNELKYNYTVASYFNACNVQRLSKEKPTYSSTYASDMFRMQMRTTIIRLQDNEQSQSESHNQSRSSSSSTINSINSSSSSNVGVIDYLLTGIVSGDYMIITQTPLQQIATKSQACRARSICLTIPRHVIGSTVNVNNKPIQQSFQKLDELSIRLRDEVFVPIQNEFLECTGVHQYPSLCSLPFELYENIFRSLNPNQLRALANVNRVLNNLIVNHKTHKHKTSTTNS